jgi:hypothetical protein
MPEKKEHIDELFRKGLSGHEYAPPPQSWREISARLERRKKRRVIFFFARVAAAGLLFLGLGGVLFMFIQDYPGDSSITSESTNSPPVVPGKIDDAGFPRPVAVPVPSLSYPDQTFVVSALTDLESVDRPRENNISFQDNLPYIKSAVTEEPELAEIISPHTIEKLVPADLEADLEEAGPALAFEGPPLNGQGNVQKGKWSATMMVAPNYSYRSLSQAVPGSPGKDQFNTNESGLFSVSGSINLIYRINKRFSVQSGLDMMRMGQTIDGIQIFNNPIIIDRLMESGLTEYYQSTPSVSSSLGEIQATSPSVYITDNHKQELNRYYSPHSITVGASPSIGDNPGQIIQGLYYLQAPVLLRYHITSGNTGLVVSGGFGANFLTGNRVILKSGNSNMTIGHTSNLNRFGISGIIAIGLERMLTRNISLLFEPRLNHFISPVNSTGNLHFHPYAFSASGGVSYRF